MELLQFQDDLLAKCKIAGKACDCCGGKHPKALKAKCLELMTLDTDLVYRDIIAWVDANFGKFSAESSASGEFDTWYATDAVRAVRDFRKRVEGTEAVADTARAEAMKEVVVG